MSLERAQNVTHRNTKLKTSFFTFSNSEIDRSKSIGRIYLNTFYMFLVVVTAYAIVRYSKKRQAEGYSIEGENRKRNEKWQKERLEREAKAKEEGAWLIHTE